MNKRQLSVLWFALVVLISMVWFPGEWFGYIIIGYPALKPESVEFVVRILLPFVACVSLIVFSLRDRKKSFQMASQINKKRIGKNSVIKSTLILSCGALIGFVLGFMVILRYQASTEKVEFEEVQWVKAPQSEFKDFCRVEGYKSELDELMDWLKELQVEEIAILYNGEEPYTSGLYKFLSDNINQDKVHVTYSEMFKKGEKYFYKVLRDIESLKPQAIIFLGNSEDRVAFLEHLESQSEEEFWKDRLDKIKWIE
jgi:hypothetical protein